MKRKAIIVLMAVSVLTGCGNDMQNKVSTETVQTTKKTEEKETKVDEAEKNELDIARLEENLSKFDNVINVAYVSENKLFVVADKMYLIDINSGEIVAQNAECDYVNGEIKVYSNDKNIIIVGKKYKDAGEEEVVFWDEEDATKQCVVYYDYQLNLVENINIYETFGLNPDFVQYVSVNKFGNLAVYDDEYRKLYLCDIDTKKKKKIFGKSNAELVYDNKIQFTISGGIEFAQNDERIVFKAECLDYPVEDGTNDFLGIGSVSLDGKEYYVTKAGDEYTKLESFHNYAILSQDCGYTSPTGEVIKYMFDTDSTEIINLKTNGESESLYCSKNGNILATSEENGDNDWNIRLYDAKSGELIVDILYDKLSSGNYREPQIYVFEELNIALLFFRTEDENSKDAFGVVQYSYKK